MKSLKESLLNRKKLTTSSLNDILKKEVVDFINKYYVHFPSRNKPLEILYDDKLDKYIVNGGRIENAIAKGKELKSLTGGLPLEFGTVEVFDIQDMPNLESLEGSPKNCEEMYIKRCGIKNLEGIGDVSYMVHITGCADLETLKGCPKNTREMWLFSLPKLKSLKYTNSKTKLFLSKDLRWMIKEEV